MGVVIVSVHASSAMVPAGLSASGCRLFQEAPEVPPEAGALKAALQRALTTVHGQVNPPPPPPPPSGRQTLSVLVMQVGAAIAVDVLGVTETVAMTSAVIRVPHWQAGVGVARVVVEGVSPVQ